MDLSNLVPCGPFAWQLPVRGAMRVPGVIYGDAGLLASMDDKVAVQLANVATLPGIVQAAYAMPDAHWGYGFPIGGVAAFDATQGGVVSAGGVGFDVSCGVRLLHTGLTREDVVRCAAPLADALFAAVPAGLGRGGALRLDEAEMDAMLSGGAVWAIAQGYGWPEDAWRIEEQGCMAGADPAQVSTQAKRRQYDEMGTLGSGNHYLEVQEVAEIYDAACAQAFGLQEGAVVVSMHCGSRGLGHQIGTEYLRRMVIDAERYGLVLPDRELACAPILSETGQAYLGAMRAAINCALANRQIITHLTRQVFARLFPQAHLDVLYDVSHNTCKEEQHQVAGRPRRLFVHRKGATRAFGPGHAELPDVFAETGQPVLVGGSMGTASYVLVGCSSAEAMSFSSSCHGAGRAMSRTAASKKWQGRAVVADLAQGGILIRSPSMRGVAEEAPGAYKDVHAVVEAAEHVGLSRRVARLKPMICIKG